MRFFKVIAVATTIGTVVFFRSALGNRLTQLFKQIFYPKSGMEGQLYVHMCTTNGWADYLLLKGHVFDQTKQVNKFNASVDQAKKDIKDFDKSNIESLKQLIKKYDLLYLQRWKALGDSAENKYKKIPGCCTDGITTFRRLVPVLEQAERIIAIQNAIGVPIPWKELESKTPQDLKNFINKLNKSDVGIRSFRTLLFKAYPQKIATVVRNLAKGGCNLINQDDPTHQNELQTVIKALKESRRVTKFTCLAKDKKHQLFQHGDQLIVFFLKTSFQICRFHDAIKPVKSDPDGLFVKVSAKWFDVENATVPTIKNQFVAMIQTFVKNGKIPGSIEQIKDWCVVHKAKLHRILPVNVAKNLDSQAVLGMEGLLWSLANRKFAEYKGYLVKTKLGEGKIANDFRQKLIPYLKYQRTPTDASLVIAVEGLRTVMSSASKLITTQPVNQAQLRHVVVAYLKKEKLLSRFPADLSKQIAAAYQSAPQRGKKNRNIKRRHSTTPKQSSSQPSSPIQTLKDGVIKLWGWFSAKKTRRRLTYDGKK